MKAIKPKKRTWAQMKWKPNCAVCQYMKRNKEFRTRVFESSYFNPDGHESPMDVVRSYGDVFGQSLVYACLKRHHGHNLVRPPVQVVDGKTIVDNRFKNTVDVIENIQPSSVTNHELGLDDFIAKGREKLSRGELQITASTFLTAIKTKMDNDAKTKDRRADMLQGLFKGAAPKRDV